MIKKESLVRNQLPIKNHAGKETTAENQKKPGPKRKIENRQSYFKSYFVRRPWSLSHRPNLLRCLHQNLRRHFFDRDIKLEHRSFRTPSPALHLPVRAHELHLRMLLQVEQQRMLPAIKLLRKCGNRFCPPRYPVSW